MEAEIVINPYIARLSNHLANAGWLSGSRNRSEIQKQHGLSIRPADSHSLLLDVMAETENTKNPEFDAETKSAFREMAGLWMEAQPSLTLYLSAIVRDPHTRDDIQQEVARTVVERFESYDRTRPFTPWVLGVARISVSKYFRLRQNHPLIFDEKIIGDLAQVVPNIESDLDSRKRALKSCIQALRGTAQKVINLRYLEQLGMQDVADRVGLTRNAVRVALHRARNVLAQCIERKLSSERNS